MAWNSRPPFGRLSLLKEVVTNRLADDLCDYVNDNWDTGLPSTLALMRCGATGYIHS